MKIAELMREGFDESRGENQGTIVFNAPNGEPLDVEDGARLYRIPLSGILFTQLALNAAWAGGTAAVIELARYFRRAKRPAGAPDKSLARPVTKVGIVGAGLMASQLAALFVQRLEVPVVLTDVDQARVDKGVGWVHEQIDGLLTQDVIMEMPNVSDATVYRHDHPITGQVVAPNGGAVM